MLVALLALTYTTVQASTPGEHSFAIFQDDFEDWDGEGWELNVGPDASYGAYWKVLDDDGNNVLSVKGTVMVVLGENYWTDYTLIVKVKLLDATETVSINTRMGEKGQGYSAGFSPNGFEFMKSTGWDTEPIYLMKIPLSMSSGTWHTFKFVGVDNKFWVYLDDELMFQYEDEDDPVLSGRISFGCGPDGVFYYDDVWVGVTHTDYAGYKIASAQLLIDEAKKMGADIDEPERMIAEARAKLEEGELDAAASLADAAAQKAKGNMELLAAESQEQPEGQQQSTQQPGTTLSIERVATIITIGGAITGFGGWVLKTRGDRRKRTILFRELMQATDDAYQRNRGDPRLCEAELLRLKDRAINEYKKNLISEKDYNALDERVREYVRELREAAGGGF